jgi:2-haloacid dehalogenase
MLIALDMFGTLSDTGSVAAELATLCGDDTRDVTRIWRTKQLEYMFRVTAMGQFPSFVELTAWSLTGALNEYGVQVPPADQLGVLVDGYRRLEPFDDVVPGLEALRALGHTIVVFSVGPRSWLQDLISTYSDLIDDVVSAEDVGVYKPHPGIYRHLLAYMGTGPSDTVVVSSNPFDLIGAGAAGLRTVWCRRDPQAVFDPWGPHPNHTVATLTALRDPLSAA